MQKEKKLSVFLAPFEAKFSRQRDLLARALAERLKVLPAFKYEPALSDANAVLSVAEEASGPGRVPAGGYRLEIERKPDGRLHAAIAAENVSLLWAAAGRSLQVLSAPQNLEKVRAGEPFVECVRPAVPERGVYMATHFQNYYERAPMSELLRYVEDLSFSGFNMLAAWLDAAWYPDGFWREPESRGSRMSERIRRLLEHARACGMRAGTVGCANEAFKRQPPAELLADASGRRGGFYPESTICPSQPGGLELILSNRRKITELTGPIDFFVYWPYDQGGCGCAACRKGGGWAERFLEIGPRVCGAVRELNPAVEIIASTWMLDERERGMVYEAARSAQCWFDAVLGDARFAEEMAAAGVQRRYVFPEISMFGCMFTSYGCNGANPAPLRFVEQARRTAKAGCGFLLYSEGIYEDINKSVWASVGARPETEAVQAVADYAATHFGPDVAGDAAALIMGLERTWGAAGLKANGADAVRLAEASRRIKATLPARARNGPRWQALRYRAELDGLMAELGPDCDLRRELRLLLEDLAAGEKIDEARRRAAGFARRLEARGRALRKLFDVHWRYLKRFHMAHTNLLFVPDEYLGKHDWAPLAAGLRKALAAGNDEAFRDAAIRAVKQWTWFRAADVEMWLL